MPWPCGIGTLPLPLFFSEAGTLGLSQFKAQEAGESIDRDLEPIESGRFSKANEKIFLSGDRRLPAGLRVCEVGTKGRKQDTHTLLNTLNLAAAHALHAHRARSISRLTLSHSSAPHTGAHWRAPPLPAQLASAAQAVPRSARSRQDYSYRELQHMRLVASTHSRARTTRHAPVHHATPTRPTRLRRSELQAPRAPFRPSSLTFVRELAKSERQLAAELNCHSSRA